MKKGLAYKKETTFKCKRVGEIVVAQYCEQFTAHSLDNDILQ